MRDYRYDREVALDIGCLTRSCGLQRRGRSTYFRVDQNSKSTCRSQRSAVRTMSNDVMMPRSKAVLPTGSQSKIDRGGSSP